MRRRLTTDHGRGARFWTSLAAALVVGMGTGLAAHGDVDLPGSVNGSRAGAGPPPRTLTMGPTVAAAVSVSPSAAMAPVPRSYLGLSFEYWSLPLWESQMPLLERTIALIHAPGTGPVTLRIGGDSADHSFWSPAPPRLFALPHWAFALAPEWLAQMRGLVQALRAKVILDLNLITDTPAAAAAWARAARAALPRHSIVAFEVGNEPDIYSHAGWLATIAGRSVIDRPLPPSLSAADYVRAFHVYATQLAALAPGVPLAGPALAHPQARAGWIAPLAAGGRRWLGMITVHRYPYSACARRGTRAFATIGRLLSPQASTGMAASLRPAVEAARDAGLALRMTELNSVTCGGRPGVSDAFATALWVPDALFALLRAGVRSVDLHVRANTINAAFALTRAGLTARPLFYGMALFCRALGPQARLVRTVVHARGALNVGAYAVRVGPSALRVVVLDKGPRSVRLRLTLPARGTAVVQRLLAPSAAATHGVTFAGQHLDRSGQWVGRFVAQGVTGRDGVYTFDVRRRSAALVTVAVAPGSLGAPRAVISPVLSHARRWRAGGRALAAGRSHPRSAPALRRRARPAGARASSRRRSAR